MARGSRQLNGCQNKTAGDRLTDRFGHRVEGPSPVCLPCVPSTSSCQSKRVIADRLIEPSLYGGVGPQATFQLIAGLSVSSGIIQCGVDEVLAENFQILALVGVFDFVDQSHLFLKQDFVVGQRRGGGFRARFVRGFG